MTRVTPFSKILTLIIFAVLAGCTKNESHKIQVNFPDWSHVSSAPGAASALDGKVGMISVNVSGAGVTNKIPYHWDRETEVEEAPNQTPYFQAPRGSLVQVLAVVEGGTAGTKRFFYGDRVVADRDTQDLNVVLQNLAATQNLDEGLAIGRYLTGVNQGPTGVFDYRFDPGSEKPSMVVTSGEVFAGWMRTTSFSTPLLRYTWPSGQTAFTLTARDNVMLGQGAQSARSARLILPIGFKNGSHTAGQYDMEAKAKRYVTVGFFGPAASTAAASSKVCFNSVNPAAPPVVSDLYATADTVDPVHGTPTDQFEWMAENTPTSPSKQICIEDPDGAASAAFSSGGFVGSVGLCVSSGTLYTDRLVVDEQKFRDEDSFVGFRGPFALKNQNEFLTKTFDPLASMLQFDWRLLPGVDAVVAGVTIFHRKVSPAQISNDDELRGRDGFKCEQFASSGSFAVPFSRIDVGTGTTTASVPVVNLTDGQRVQAVACVRSLDGRFYKSAVMGYSNLQYSGASLEFDPVSILPFGPTSTGSYATQSIIIKNVGNASATSVMLALAAPFSFEGGTFPGVGGTCTTTLSGQSSCIVSIRYSPTASGPSSVSVGLSYMDSVITAPVVSAALSGTAY